MRKKLFLYGFEPFCEFPTNVTEMIANQFHNSANVVPHVFPVRFNEKQFTQELERHAPHAVLGMGQDSRARKIRLERKAVNERRDRNSSHATHIRKSGPDSLFCNTPTISLPGTTVTYDAGTYVCNFSMYISLEYCIPRGVPYQFLHIPADFNLRDAKRIVQQITRILLQSLPLLTLTMPLTLTTI